MNDPHQEGANVAITDVDEDQGKATYKKESSLFGEKRVFWQKCDVSSQEQFESLIENVEKFFNKRIDVLVNNAGISGGTSNWKKCIDINLVNKVPQHSRFVYNFCLGWRDARYLLGH